LGIRRTEYYWDRKILAGSTPLVAGASRITEMFEAGDQRRYNVPCPHCGHMDVLTFRENDDRGHFMKWPEGKPEEAHFVCRKNGCVIEHKSKRDMVAAGEWRAEAPFRGHASFHIWAAYSYSPNATWGQLAAEFVDANRGGVEKLKTFVNTVLGETWHEKGEAPDWKRLYDRREQYERGTVPEPVVFLTAGVDVQRDRLVWEVIGWGDDRQNWSIDAAVIPGSTSTEAPWLSLDALLSRTWPRVDGQALSIHMLAVDSGDQTQVVYNWARRYPMSRVIACKGVASAKTLIGAPSAVDVTVRGKRMARGYKVWPVGGGIAKSELYGWLRLERPAAEGGEPFPPGYCHFPEYGEDFFKQITAEHLVKVVNHRTRFTTLEWQVLPGRENHWLDCRVYARAAAALAGLDRHAASMRAARPAAAAEAGQPTAPPSPPRPAEGAPPAPAARPAGGGWLGGRSGGTVGRAGGWLSRRR
jgi:phage terminase large subunit GpA-like protein